MPINLELAVFTHHLRVNRKYLVSPVDFWKLKLKLYADQNGGRLKILRLGNLSDEANLEMFISLVNEKQDS